MHILRLNKGKSVLLDDNDIVNVGNYHWFIDRYGYAVTSFKDKKTNKSKQMKMHRLIMNASRGQIIDHIDRDKLNNQKNNLRFTSQQINVLNRGLHKNNKSGVKGITWQKINNKWRAQICVNRKAFYLGLYSNFNSAASARQEAERKYHSI